jgi:hypothetical protein
MAKKAVKIDIPLIRKWVRKLESGILKQGKSTLVRTNDKGVNQYCCLGVACVVAGIPQKKFESYAMLNDFIPGIRLRNRLGLDTEVEFRHETTTIENVLVRLNDGDDFARIPGRKFATIAKYKEGQEEVISRILQSVPERGHFVVCNNNVS